MHIHIAIFRWKPDASLADVEKALLDIQGLSSKVPGITEISVGENGSRYSEGYTHVVLVRGETEQSLADYRNHPDHVRAAKVLDDAEDHGIGVDFVTGEFGQQA